MSSFQLYESGSDPSAVRMSSYFGQLFITAGIDCVRYCILDTDRNTFVALADHRATQNIPPEKWPEAFSQFILSHELLNRKYPVVMIALDLPYHTPVPTSLFDAGHLMDYLQINLDLPEGLLFRSDFIPETDAWNVYGMHTDWIEETKKRYPHGMIFHSTTPLLKRLAMVSRQYSGQDRVFLHFSGKKFHLAAFSDRSMLLFNTFQYETDEDVLYFTLYAAEQLKLRAGEILLKLSSDDNLSPGTVKLLQEFIPSASFLERPEAFGYSAALTFPSYRYQSLFSLALCGS